MRLKDYGLTFPNKTVWQCMIDDSVSQTSIITFNGLYVGDVKFMVRGARRYWQVGLRTNMQDVHDSARRQYELTPEFSFPYFQGKLIKLIKKHNETTGLSPI